MCAENTVVFTLTEVRKSRSNTKLISVLVHMIDIIKGNRIHPQSIIVRLICCNQKHHFMIIQISLLLYSIRNEYYFL